MDTRVITADKASVLNVGETNFVTQLRRDEEWEGESEGGGEGGGGGGE